MKTSQLLIAAFLLSSCAQVDYAHDAIGSIVGRYEFEQCYEQVSAGDPVCYEFEIEIKDKFNSSPNVLYTVNGEQVTRELMGNTYLTDSYAEVLFDRYGPEDIRPVHDYEDGVHLFRLEAEGQTLYISHFRSPVDDILVKDRYQLTKI